MKYKSTSPATLLLIVVQGVSFESKKIDGLESIGESLTGKSKPLLY